jgi:hypothetical protein
MHVACTIAPAENTGFNGLFLRTFGCVGKRGNMVRVSYNYRAWYNVRPQLSWYLSLMVAERGDLSYTGRIACHSPVHCTPPPVPDSYRNSTTQP